MLLLSAALVSACTLTGEAKLEAASDSLPELLDSCIRAVTGRSFGFFGVTMPQVQCLICACSLTGEAKLEAALDSVPEPRRDPSYQPPAAALEALVQRGGQAAAKDARWDGLALLAISSACWGQGFRVLADAAAKGRPGSINPMQVGLNSHCWRLGACC